MNELKGIQKLIATVKYYSGINQFNIRRNLRRISRVNYNKVIAFSQQATPRSSQDIKVRCKRIESIIHELGGMRDAITESSKELQEKTQKLNFFIRTPVKVTQLFFSMFYSNASRMIQYELNLLQGNNGGRGIIQEYAGHGTNYGIKVGSTSIPQEETAIDVFAKPDICFSYPRNLATFKDHYKIFLNIGSREIAYFSICMKRRQWKDTKKVIQQIFVSGVRSNVYRTENDDLPLVRKIVQLVIEIMHRQKSELLEWDNSYDQAHVLIAGSFETNEATERGITGLITNARAAGKVFPPYHDEASFPLMMTNKPKNPVLAKRADFFPGSHKTWGQVIREEPILLGEEAIL